MVRAGFVGVAVAAVLGAAGGAQAALVNFTSNLGLRAEVEFTLVTPTELRLRARNLTANAPGQFGAADLLLTTISFDLGEPGKQETDPAIVGGSVFTGPNSQSHNFSIANVGPNADVSGEWGYGNTGGSELLPNYISTTSPVATLFSAANLDGIPALGGPQGGVASALVPLPPESLGVVTDEVIVTLLLSGPVTDLSFVATSQVTVTYGLDKVTLIAPAPGAGAAALGAALLAGARRRRR